MKNWLLVDWGASRIKTILVRDGGLDKDTFEEWPSNFLKSPAITRKEVLDKLDSIISTYYTKYEMIEFQDVAFCSILGGFYEGDTYYSWKSDKKFDKSKHVFCELISGALNLPAPCKFNDVFGLNVGPSKWGKMYQHYDYRGLNFYTPIVDTHAVRLSADFFKAGGENLRDVVVNLGTGSQVISVVPDRVISYIPSGRALNVFADFFAEFGVDMFKEFEVMKWAEIKNSAPFRINLALFEGALGHNYNFGSIQNIREGNFTKDSLLKSILVSYLSQYGLAISSTWNRLNVEPRTRILLAGGISKKLPIVKEYFEDKFPDTKVEFISEAHEETHLGLYRLVVKEEDGV